MVALYLLLALTTSYSIYAADTDTEKKALLSTSDTTQLTPETVPLPNGLVAIASLNEDLSLSLDGCFFPDKLTAFVSLLSLANPGKDSQENKSKLTEMQTLIKEGVSNGLQKICTQYLSGPDASNKTHRCSNYGGKIKSQCNRDHKEVVETVGTHVYKTLWIKLSKNKDPKNLIERIAQYKVRGLLYLLAEKDWVEYELASKCGKLPCNFVASQNGGKESIITNSPKNNPKVNTEIIDQLLIQPLKGKFDTSDNIAKAFLGYLLLDEPEDNNQDVKVVIINRSILKPLIEKYHPKPAIQQASTVKHKPLKKLYSEENFILNF